MAAISGHCCAAGAMMALCFDYRVMSTDRGFFFIPGVDLGLVYSPFQIALMKARLPQRLHRDVILYNSKRWVATELLAHGVLDHAVESNEVLRVALLLANDLKPKGRGAARRALGRIKQALHSNILQAMEQGAMNIAGREKGVDRPDPTQMTGPSTQAKI